MKKHLGYYLSLSFILFFGLLLVLQIQDGAIKIYVAILTAIFYISYGLIHHGLSHSLNKKIVIEYVLMGALGATAILLV
ncbi:MAG: hypothetical protein M1409_05165 [Actinobacteria bacterium]|nr:hypothetical protein [Actinomycetota bacterium]